MEKKVGFSDVYSIFIKMEDTIISDFILVDSLRTPRTDDISVISVSHNP